MITRPAFGSWQLSNRAISTNTRPRKHLLAYLGAPADLDYLKDTVISLQVSNMAPHNSLEATMLQELTQDLGADFWDYTLTPDPSPAKPKVSQAMGYTALKTPTKSTKAGGSVAASAPTLAAKLYTATDHDMTSFLEGSENWNLDDDPFTPIKSSKSSVQKKPSYIPDPFTRCVVEYVTDEYVDSRWMKTVLSKVEQTAERVAVYLYDDWYQTDVRAGDVFNVIGTFTAVPSSAPSSSSSAAPTRSIAITAQAHLLIMHPDLLLTATALSTAPQCTRRPLLSGMVRSSTDITPAMVWGNMLHEVMQRCLKDDKWDETFLKQCIDRAVQGRLGDLVKLGVTEETAKREVLDRSRGLQIFAEKYLSPKPKPEGALSNTRGGFNEAPALLAITKLIDIEEDIWSPTYGLKGKLDATVSGIISNSPAAKTTQSSGKSFFSSANSLNSEDDDSQPFPLELKTGRAIAGMDHRAQTILYTLLVSERYASDVRDGLLFYTQSEGGEVVRVPRGWHEVRGLLSVRNELAGYMWRRIRKPTREFDMDIDSNNTIMTSPTPTPTTVSVAIEAGEEETEDQEPFLPAPIDDERVCKRCYVADTCMLFRKAHPNHVWPEPSSNGSEPLSAKAAAKRRATFEPPVPAFIKEVFDEKTGHLTPSQTAFFRKWERLLALEERDIVRFKRELWTLGAAERERRGRCFGNMVLVPLKKQNPESASADDEDEAWGAEHKIHRYTYTFARSKEWLEANRQFITPTNSSSQVRSVPGKDNSLLSGHINVGDPVTVSIEPNMLALARGFVLELTPDEVVLGIDHQLDVTALQERIARVPAASGTRRGEAADKVIFRIDKDEMFGGMARVRNNLAHLFYADGDTRRLQLVVDLRAPRFSEPTPPFAAGSVMTNGSQPIQGTKSLPPHLARLNPSQLAAMGKVLEAEDYALVLGMPGTGKTTVIAALIRELVGRGKTVLLSSYTHSAVDTILMKLQGLWMDEADVDENGNVDFSKKKIDFGILRLGNVDKVQPDVRKYTLDSRRKATTVEQLEVQLMSPPVVATTCLSIEDPLFSRRHFDYCIVDEASQITLPTCLGPLRFADTFVLVGDHFQLPPLVKNYEARKGGLDVSLFRLLSEAHPEAVVDLRFQYRMNKEIMTLSNKLIYQDRLRCGNEEVANRRLKLGNRDFLKKLHRSNKGQVCGNNMGKKGCWLEKLADESCKAVFVDTDALPAFDSRVGDLVQNTTEAELVRQLTETLLESGVHESQIGIITLYRQQVKVLQHLLAERKGVEILTADKSQGRDKDCIIISLVRSNEAGMVGDLVKDWRRMNVSFTRARKKLVIFGSRKTLMGEPLLSQFFELMQDNDWILTLPRGADKAHSAVFDLCTVPAKRVQGITEDMGGVSESRDKNTAPAAATRAPGKENASTKDSRPMKKLRGTTKGAGKGVLSGRPILLDLISNET